MPSDFGLFFFGWLTDSSVMKNRFLVSFRGVLGADRRGAARFRVVPHVTEMVPPVGLEPTTPALRMPCSTN